MRLVKAAFILCLASACLAVTDREDLPKAEAVGPATGNQALLGVLLYCPTGTSPCYRGAAHLQTATNWEKDIFSADDFPEIRGSDLLLPRPITDKLWFLLGFGYNTDYGDGMVLRTTDGGVTWSSFARPQTNHVWQDFAADAYGRLWGISHDETTTYSGSVKVWHSDDGGNNWEEDLSEVNTCGNTRMYRIVTHPTDPLKIAIYGRTNLCVLGPLYHRVTITADGGQTWATKTSAQFATSSTGHEADLVMTPSGRLVLAGQAARPQENSNVDSVIMTSDDNGETWMLRKDFGFIQDHRNLGPVGEADGSALYVVHIDSSATYGTKVWQSVDQGATWSAFNSNVPQYNDSYDGRGGIAYDPVEDAIYVANEGGLTVNQNLVMKMSPPNVNGTWQDVSYNLVPFGPHSSYSIVDYGQHIAITPAKRRTNGLGGQRDNRGTAFAGGPVNTANGNEYHSHTDLAIPGRGVGLEFTRSYNSQDPRNGALGYGWTFNYDTRLEIDRTDPNQTQVTRFSAGGGSALFLENPDGSYSAPPGVYETLTENPNDFVLTTKQQIRYVFDLNGRFNAIKDRNDNTTDLTYTTGFLTVTEPGGRSLVIEYDGSNRVKKVTDPLPAPDTRTLEFFYDGSGDLWKVKDVKGGITEYAYDNHRLTSIDDANPGPVWQNVYDSASRVVEQIDKAGNSTCFFYGTLPAYSGAACPAPDPAPLVNETIVRDPNGNQTTYTRDSEGRTSKVKNAVGDEVINTFDSNGELSCATGKSGTKERRTYYKYVAGNLTETSDPLHTNAS